MQFQSQIVVIGIKRSKGEFEGTSYDSTKVYTSTVLDASKGDAVGHAGSEYTWGKSDNFNKLATLKFPVQCEATFEQVSTGKALKMVLIDLKPIQQSNKVA